MTQRVNDERRDRFAAAALTGLLSQYSQQEEGAGGPDWHDPAQTARRAVILADAMIDALSPLTAEEEAARRG